MLIVDKRRVISDKNKGTFKMLCVSEAVYLSRLINFCFHWNFAVLQFEKYYNV